MAQSSNKKDENLPEVIQTEEMKESLLRSGYLLENRIESLLSEEGYVVDASKMVVDALTGKHRELDLHAVSLHHYQDDPPFRLHSVLIVECVNNPQPVALFTKDPIPGPGGPELEIRCAGIPTK